MTIHLDKTERVTLADVAGAAGVSEITVSRVVRGMANVSQATVSKVEEAIARTGYVRNRLAGAMAGDLSNQIAVILPSLSNSVFADLLNGLEVRLQSAGFHSVLGISNYDSAREAKLVESLLGWQPGGLVIAPTRLSDRAVRLLERVRIPVVEVMDIDRDPTDMVVGISHRQAGKSMAYYLIGRGYRSFGYVGHDIGADHRAAIRRDGFRAALQESGLDFETEVTAEAESSVPLGRELTGRILSQRAPRLLYFSNDDMAMGGLFEAMSRGLQVPRNLAIAGFNGLQIGQSAPVALTTVESRRSLIGQRAADQLIARFAGQSVERRIDVGFTLLPGESA
ncbi:LacI family DNA-binding transcriptional regulator [Algihabitans albus]|uniref:LacI family DNA-binding transcriptional regulator n=1 Tax=Algihabitans albus TaxID=2164067 RepID=UPI001ABC9030|nr:LacI family DNA-binding transcriptional regulator [Algihabitans albus]